jgi:hypothetical protein
MVLMGNTKGHQYVWQILFQRSTAPCTTKVEAGLIPDSNLSSDEVEATAKSVVRPKEGQLD